MRNCTIGSMYWSMPVRLSGIFGAAALNSSIGTIITNPAPMPSSVFATDTCPNVACPLTCSTTVYTSANGNSTAVSTISPSTAPTPTRFLISPYVPNVTARPSATHGGPPYSAVSTTTLRAARPMAVHCEARSRSLNTTTPNAMLTRGVMK